MNNDGWLGLAATPQLQAVRTYYDGTGFEYRLLWSGQRDRALHFGYYDATVKSHTSSLLKLNEIVAAYAHLTIMDQVLDAGCGLGGSSLWLAQTIGCCVTGITIVPAQITQAQKYAKTYGVMDKTHFQLEDFAHTSFPAGAFDVVWAVESVVHAESKAAFLREAFRLLRPGGRLIMAEYTLREQPPLSQPERQAIQPWLDGWAMPNLLTVGHYQSLMQACGFAPVTVNDVTSHVLPSLTRLGYFCTLFAPWLIKIGIGFGVVNRHTLANRVATAIAVGAFQQGLCRYSIFLAHKR